MIFSKATMSVTAQHAYLKWISKKINLEFHNIICSGAAFGDNDYKKIFPNANIIFVDITSGDGIDFTWNLEHSPPLELESSCDLFISTSVLEHVARPWLAAKNIMKTISPSGFAFITVPWVWEYHAFPCDYWRMSPDAIDILFEGSREIDTRWVTQPDGIAYKDRDKLPLSHANYAKGKTHAGNEFNVRIHPLVQVFQLRQMIEEDRVKVS